MTEVVPSNTKVYRLYVFHTVSLHIMNIYSTRCISSQLVSSHALDHFNLVLSSGFDTNTHRCTYPLVIQLKACSNSCVGCTALLTSPGFSYLVVGKAHLVLS